MNMNIVLVNCAIKKLVSLTVYRLLSCGVVNEYAPNKGCEPASIETKRPNQRCLDAATSPLSSENAKNKPDMAEFRTSIHPAAIVGLRRAQSFCTLHHNRLPQNLNGRIVMIDSH
jgi:hypothetical protein